MKIILLRDVKKVGRKGEIKDVSDGYARNFLIAKNLAAPVTESTLTKLKQTEAEERASLNKNLELVKKLAGEEFNFTVKAGENGAVFGSVKREDIENKLRESGYKDVEVFLQRPIKTLGVSEIDVKLGGVPAKLKIKVLSEKK